MPVDDSTGALRSPGAHAHSDSSRAASVAHVRPRRRTAKRAGEGGELAATPPSDPAIQAQNTTLVHYAGFASPYAAPAPLPAAPALDVTRSPDDAPWVLRYARQAAAVEILCGPDIFRYRPDEPRWDVPWHRQAGCHRWLAVTRSSVPAFGPPHGGKLPTAVDVEKRTTVDLAYDASAARVYLTGLQSCGSAWVCAVCGGVIADHQRARLAELLAAARSLGGRQAHLSLTVRHTADDGLRPLLKDLAAAKRKLLSGKAWQDFTAATGYRGSIRAIEVTSGGNGWHPHFHILLFFDGAYEGVMLNRGTETIEAWLTRRWLACLVAVGRSGLREVAAVLSDASEWSAEEYITKIGHESGPDRANRWDADAEMTMHTRKKAGMGGVTPTGMLDGYLGVGLLRGDPDELPVAGDPAWSLPSGRGEDLAWYADHFREYAAATKGMHMFHASPGLYESYRVEAPAADEEVSAGEVEDRGLPLLASLSVRQWRQVLRNNARGELRIIAAKHAAAGDLGAFWADMAGLGIHPSAYHRSIIDQVEGVAS